MKRKNKWYLTKTQLKKINVKNMINQCMTMSEKVIGYLKSKVLRWKRRNPKPKEDDLFYREDYHKWVQKYEDAHDKLVKQLKKYIKRYTKNIAEYILRSRSNEYSIMFSKLYKKV